jgi:hypothetical protein
MEVGGKRHVPAALSPGKAPEPVWMLWRRDVHIIRPAVSRNAHVILANVTWEICARRYGNKDEGGIFPRGVNITKLRNFQNEKQRHSICNWRPRISREKCKLLCRDFGGRGDDKCMLRADH